MSVPADQPRGWVEAVVEAGGGVVFEVRTRPDRAVEYISDTIQGLFGQTPGELRENPALFGSQIAEDDADRLSAILALEPGQRTEEELRATRQDGSSVWMRVRAQCVARADGSTVLRGVGFDVTDLRSAREQLAESEQLYRLLAENASDVVALGDASAVLQWVSPSVQYLHGLDPDDLIGRPVTSFLHPDDVAQMRTAGTHANDGQRAEYEARWRTEDGTYRWMAVTLRPVTDSTGAVVGRVAAARDIEVERQTREALARSEERFRTALESAPAGMAVVSPERDFLEVNPALCRLLGHDEAWLTEHGVGDVLDAHDDYLDRRMRADLLASGQRSVTREHRMIRADGRRIWVEHSIGVVRDETGTATSFVSQFIDVTESRQVRDQLRFLAAHDSLTELMNRRELFSRVEALLLDASHTGRGVAVLFLDLDSLKPLNDAHGHVVGDQVIREVATRIRATVRAGDLVARYGGDEFITVLPAVDRLDDAVAIAEKIHTAVRAPVTTTGGTVPVTLSIGVALAQPGDDPDTLLSRADAALYRAKRDGRDRTATAPPPPGEDW